jgi:phosphoribosylanthranilate isomerase
VEKMRIKICGVTSSRMAEQIGKLGIDWIGILLYAGSPRSVSLERAVEVAEGSRAGGAEPVLLLVDEELELALEAIERTRVRAVQIQGERAKRLLLHLPRDLVIFDAMAPFDEELADWKIVHGMAEEPPAGPWLLAGGISPDNVRERIGERGPDGIDVSSGVERVIGVKDLVLIERLIDAV